MFRIVPSYLRKGYREAVMRQDTETFLRCLENGFHYFGGVAAVLNLDNLKAAVLKADWYDPAIHPKLADFCRHYGVCVVPCRPAAPQHKGKVASGVKYVRNNGLQDELDVRASRQVGRRNKAACFRDTRRLEDFDFSFNPPVPRGRIYQLAPCRFVRQKRDGSNRYGSDREPPEGSLRECRWRL